MDKGTLPSVIEKLEPPKGVQIVLWTALLGDLADGSSRFVQAVADQLRDAPLSGIDRVRWLGTLTTLRQHLLPSIDDLGMMVRLEDRLHQAEQLLVGVESELAAADGARDVSADAQRGPLYGAPSLPSTSDTDPTPRILNRLGQAPDTESVLRIALEELGTLLGARVAVARLGTRKQLLSAEFDSDES